MGEEIKVVTRQETFNDLAVRELAKSRSACVCKIQFGRCDKTECAHCQIGKQYRNCYNAMNDYDRSRLASYVANQYAIDSHNPEHWMNHSAYKRYMGKWYAIIITFMIVCAVIIGLFMCGPADKPDKQQQALDVDKMIVVTVMRTQIDIKDVNKDSRTNCIDYATTFKIFWDNYFPEYKESCSIVRNKGVGIHHLFICIWWEGQRIDVEPWTGNPYKYLMSENWSEVYKPENNIYGETSRWLKEVKDGY